MEECRHRAASDLKRGISYSRKARFFTSIRNPLCHGHTKARLELLLTMKWRPVRQAASYGLSVSKNAFMSHFGMICDIIWPLETGSRVPLSRAVRRGSSSPGASLSRCRISGSRSPADRKRPRLPCKSHFCSEIHETRNPGTAPSSHHDSHAQASCLPKTKAFRNRQAPTLSIVEPLLNFQWVMASPELAMLALMNHFAISGAV